jgi:hypothetical protein
VRQTLGRSTDGETCAALAARIALLVGGALEDLRGRHAGIACAPGCNFCCHLRVMVYPHEALALLHHLHVRMPAQRAQEVRERLLANATLLQTHDPAQPRPPTACAFLVDGQCSAYEARPISCSGYHSLNRALCQRRYETSTLMSVGIPVSQELRQFALTLQDELGRAVESAGLSADRVELQTTLAALLRQPALVDTWRLGGKWAADDRRLLQEP